MSNALSPRRYARSLFILVAAFVIRLGNIVTQAQEAAAPKSKVVAVQEATPYPDKGLLISESGTFNYRDVRLLDAISRLALEAKIKLLISDDAQKVLREKTVTVMLGKITPMKAIASLMGGLGLDLNSLDGEYYLRSYREAHGFDENPGPYRAARLAAYKRLYFEALMRAGFSREEAMRILVSEPTPPIILQPFKLDQNP